MFNRNIHLEKVHSRFTNWVTFFNKIYNKDITVLLKLSPNEISLDTGWLYGFLKLKAVVMVVILKILE